MTYLADTDRVVDYLKGRPEAVELLDRLFQDGLAISITTYVEVYEGIYYGSDPKQNERIFRSFLQGARILFLTLPVARKLANLRGELRAKGQLLPMPDLVIAATALHHNLILVTRNTRHFERIEQLTLYQDK